MTREHLHDRADWFNRRLQDGGPVYKETDLDFLIVEPWNAVSSLLIVLPAVYWLFRIGKDYRDFKFLLFAIPLMILGGSGSTLFHAFRASRIFLVMDFLPTAILTVSLTIYFWVKVFNRWWHVLFIIIPSVFVRFVLFRYLDLSEFTAINISYTLTGILIGLPILILLIRTRYQNLYLVILSIVFFITAIIFREMDSRNINYLPMGTHFLWHAFTGFGAYTILAFLYHFRKLELGNSN